MLYDGSGKGGDFLGWVSLPGRIGSEELEAVEACARSLASLADVIVVIGIGGSYLGTKAVYEAMNDSFQLLRKKQDRPLLLFAGQNLSEDYLSELLAAVKPYRIAAIVISKSGTTTEPAVAFRLIKEEIESRYGKAEASKRIEMCIRDRSDLARDGHQIVGFLALHQKAAVAIVHFASRRILHRVAQHVVRRVRFVTVVDDLNVEKPQQKHDRYCDNADL